MHTVKNLIAKLSCSRKGLPLVLTDFLKRTVKLIRN